MNCVVHDTVGLLEPLFTSTKPIKERLALGMKVLHGQDTDTSIFHYIKPVLDQRYAYGAAIMEASQKDGYDVIMQQQGFGAYNPTNKLELKRWVFEQFKALNILDWLKEKTEYYAQQLKLDLPERIEITLLPADGANRTLMVKNNGVSCFATVPGYIVLQLWPSECSLLRLEMGLARALVIQSKNHQKRPTTLADYLKTESLALKKSAELFSDDTPWLSLFASTDAWQKKWQKELNQVAKICGLNSYAELRTNLYGNSVMAEDNDIPDAYIMDTEELAYAQEVISDNLQSEDSLRIAACLYGDDLVSPQGTETVGLAPYAGFEVAYKS